MRIQFNNTTQQAPATVAATSTYTRAVNVASGYTPPAGTGNYYRLRPTDTTRSTIHYRAGQRGSFAAMPPVVSHAISDDLQAKLQAWIAYMTVGNGYPAPAPQ
jgi:hypothetical protein